MQTSLRRFLFCLLSITTHNPNSSQVELLVTDPDRHIQEVQNHFLTSAGRFSPRKKREKEAATALPDIVTVHPIDEDISPQIQKVYSRCCHRHLAVLLLLHDLQPILLIPKASTLFFALVNLLRLRVCTLFFCDQFALHCLPHSLLARVFVRPAPGVSSAPSLLGECSRSNPMTSVTF